MKQRNSKCFIKLEEQNNFPPLKTNENSEIISLCSEQLRSNSINSVSFGTEAGVLSQLGFQTIVCGPGSITQAHKPDEYIEMNQLQKCEDFLEKNNQYTVLKMNLKDLDFNLPKNLIALYPKKPRHNSNLVIVNSGNKIVKFKEIINELNAGDAIILNDTRVIHADFDGFIENQRISINLNKLEDKKNIWSVFVKANKKLKEGDVIKVFNTFNAQVTSTDKGIVYMRFILTYEKFKKKLKNMEGHLSLLI